MFKIGDKVQFIDENLGKIVGIPYFKTGIVTRVESVLSFNKRSNKIYIKIDNHIYSGYDTWFKKVIDITEDKSFLALFE